MTKVKTKNWLERTSHGFVYGSFKDKYGQTCSLQKSSRVAAGPDDECIWLGVENKHGTVKIFATSPEAKFFHGNGWQEIYLAECFVGCDVRVPDRMHLTQKMVKMLLPALQHFAETGELPEPHI